MDILFCDRCHESIPDADLESGKAVRVGGRVLHVPCAFRRALPGPARTLTFLLALGAAGGAAYAVAKVSGKDDEVSGRTALRAAWQEDVRASGARLERIVEDGRRADREATQAAVNAAVAGAADRLTDQQRNGLSLLSGKLDGYATEQSRRIEGLEDKIGRAARMLEEVRDLAARSGTPTPTPAPDAAMGSEAPPAVPPSAPTPAPAAPAPGAGPVPAPGAPPVATDPEGAKRHKEAFEKAIRKLRDPDNGIAFSATYDLRDLRDLAATPFLVETLKGHKDYYVRMGAATALGELKACDAVTPLLDGLDDKDDIVQQAAAEALTTITGQDQRWVVGLTKKERRAKRDEWAKWWKEHESEVRARLGQPAGAPPAAAPK